MHWCWSAGVFFCSHGSLLLLIFLLWKKSYLDLDWLCYKAVRILMHDLCLSMGKQIFQLNLFILTFKNVLTFEWGTYPTVHVGNVFLMGSNLFMSGFLFPNRYISVSGPLALHRGSIQFSFFFFIASPFVFFFEKKQLFLSVC